MDDMNKAVSEAEIEDYRKLDENSPMTDEEGIVRDKPLLAGYIDKDGVLHTTFSYREMDGKDEEALSKADVRSNGAKVVNVLCERCVIAIGTIQKKDVGLAEWGKIIRSMTGGDLDWMAFNIRVLSKGTEITFRYKCPNCGQELVTVMNTDEVETIPFKGLFDIPFELKRGYKDKAGIHKTGTIRLMNGLDREFITPILIKNQALATTNIIARTMKLEDDVPVSVQNVATMKSMDRDYLADLMKDNSFGIDINAGDVVCESCGKVISQDLGRSDFF